MDTACIAHEASLFRLAIHRNETQKPYPVKRIRLWILTEHSAVIPWFYSDFGNVCR